MEKITEKRYITVARILAKSKDFNRTSDLAKMNGMEVYKFAASVQRAKEFLATHGIMVTNKTSGKKTDAKGYKRASVDEFEAEIFKSCTRAASHIAQSFKLVSIIEASGKVDADFESIKRVLHENIKAIDFPVVDRTVLKKIGGGKPKFLDEIAEEEV